MPITNIFKTDYDQKTIFDGPATKLSREVDKGFKIAAKKYGWPDMSFRSQIHAECRGSRARKTRPKQAKELDFLTRIDEEFPIEYN